MGKTYEGKTEREIDLEIKMRTAEAEYEHAQRMEKEASVKLGDARRKLESASLATNAAFTKYRDAVNEVLAERRKDD